MSTRTLTWGLRKARIWYSELPDWSYTPDKISERHLDISVMHRKRQQSVAVELLRPVSGRAYYGGLGATFSPEDTKKLVVRVFSCLEQKNVWPRSLAMGIDETDICLPEEYVESIFEHVLQYKLTQELGSGVLSFTHAVNGVIGSSPSFFGKVSLIVIRMLNTNAVAFTDEELINLIEDKKVNNT